MNIKSGDVRQQLLPIISDFVPYTYNIIYYKTIILYNIMKHFNSIVLSK